MRILFLGDIVGRPGRRAVFEQIGFLRKELGLDGVLANAENASSGIGLTPKDAQQLHEAGLLVLTSGNHIWRYKEIYSFLDEHNWLLRPANYPSGVPGHGYSILEIKKEKIAIINLQGRVFMQNVDCPFQVADQILASFDKELKLIIIDFHAEATSEKKALLYYLSGRVSALLGTHTHVQTTDALIVNNKTGFITDVGMTGPYQSVIGMEPKAVIKNLTHCLPQRLYPAKGEVIIQGALLDLDPQTGQTINIQPWQKIIS